MPAKDSVSVGVLSPHNIKYGEQLTDREIGALARTGELKDEQIDEWADSP